jgi:transcriptional regulator with XRE-family HTH domain
MQVLSDVPRQGQLVQPIASLLGAFKAARELNDTQLGELLGVSQSTASEWVGGRRIPEIERAKGIAAALGIPEDEAAAAISYARRRRAQSLEEALGLITQLEATVKRLEARLDELERRPGRPDPRGPKQRP